jgi:preprotein translocase subunit SecG
MSVSKAKATTSSNVSNPQKSNFLTDFTAWKGILYFKLIIRQAIRQARDNKQNVKKKQKI